MQFKQKVGALVAHWVSKGILECYCLNSNTLKAQVLTLQQRKQAKVLRSIFQHWDDSNRKEVLDNWNKNDIEDDYSLSEISSIRSDVEQEPTTNRQQQQQQHQQKYKCKQWMKENNLDDITRLINDSKRLNYLLCWWLTSRSTLFW